MLKAVIFDVDRTLIDSLDLHAQAWVDAFKEFGHDVEFDTVRGQIGKGGDPACRIHFPQHCPVFGMTSNQMASSQRAIRSTFTRHQISDA